MPGERLVIKPRRWLLVAVRPRRVRRELPAPRRSPRPARPRARSIASCRRWPTAISPRWRISGAPPRGPPRGPASRPIGERRIAIMHAYLRNESHRVVSDTPDGRRDAPRAPGRDPAPALFLDRALHGDQAGRRELDRHPGGRDRGREPGAALQPRRRPSGLDRPGADAREPSALADCYLTRSARAGCRRSPSDARRRSDGRRLRSAVSRR